MKICREELAAVKQHLAKRKIDRPVRLVLFRGEPAVNLRRGIRHKVIRPVAADLLLIQGIRPGGDGLRLDSVDRPLGRDLMDQDTLEIRLDIQHIDGRQRTLRGTGQDDIAAIRPAIDEDSRFPARADP